MGFLGRELAQACFQRGDTVCAIKKTWTSDDVNLPIDLDILDLEKDKWKTHWAEYQTWVCLLPPRSSSDYVALIGKIATTAKQLNIQHLVMASSIGVYGEAHRVCDENSEIDTQNEKAQILWAAEQQIWNSGVPHIDILRFGGLYAAERHPIQSLLKKQQITDGGQPVNMIHRDRAISALLKLTAHPNQQRIRNIVEDEHPSRQMFYQSEALKLGLPCPDFLSTGEESGRIIQSLYTDWI